MAPVAAKQERNGGQNHVRTRGDADIAALNALQEFQKDLSSSVNELVDPESHDAFERLQRREQHIWRKHIAKSKASVVHNMDRAIQLEETRIAVKKMQAVRQGNSESLTPSTFARMVRAVVNDTSDTPRDMLWDWMGKTMMGVSRASLGLTTIRDLGTIRRRELGPRQNIIRETGDSATVKDGDSERLTKDDQMNRVGKEIMQTVLADWDANHEPIPLHLLALNPGSYSQTIENLFYIGFLVRDQRLGLIPADNGIPMVTPRIKPHFAGDEPAEDEDGDDDTARPRKDASARSQLAVTMTVELWQHLCELYKEDLEAGPYIADRSHLEHAVADSIHKTRIFGLEDESESNVNSS